MRTYRIRKYEYYGHFLPQSEPEILVVSYEYLLESLLLHAVEEVYRLSNSRCIGDLGNCIFR